MFHINLKKNCADKCATYKKRYKREREKKREIIVVVRRRSTDIQLYFLVEIQQKTMKMTSNFKTSF